MMVLDEQSETLASLTVSSILPSSLLQDADGIKRSSAVGTPPVAVQGSLHVVLVGLLGDGALGIALNTLLA
jgi:hypothetical protein